MATQIQPDKETLASNLETPPVVSSQPEVQATNTPTQPQGRVYTEAEMQTIHELYGQTLRENEKRLNDLQAQIARQQTQPQSNPENDDFLTNGRNIVGEEIERRLQPFSQFIQQQQTQTLYTQLKDQFKRHPTFSAFFNIPQAEALLDQQVMQMPPANVNTQSIAGLISQIYGYMQLNNMIPQQQIVTQQPVQQPVIPQQPTNPQTNMSITPPHLRPSAPPMPSMSGQNLTPKGNPMRQLTELERRLARENGLTEAAYIDWLNESPSNVFNSDVGREGK